MLIGIFSMVGLLLYTEFADILIYFIFFAKRTF